jgi:hypothetical protein
VLDHTKALLEPSLLGVAALIVTRHQLVDAIRVESIEDLQQAIEPRGRSWP